MPPKTAMADVAQSPEIVEWMKEFADAVRAVDYARGRDMFASHVVAFGTRTAAMGDLDDLHDNQWTHVWGVTRGFDFDYRTAYAARHGDFAWIAASWSSEGQRDGNWFTRRGRSTFVLHRIDGRWLAVHSHLSLDPVRS